MWPHRWQPTRLPHPWDSPGRNTGVGCHFLLQCMKVKSESEVTQSCPTLRDPMDHSPPGSSIPGIFQARGLEWGAIAFSSRRVQKIAKERRDNMEHLLALAGMFSVFDMLLNLVLVSVWWSGYAFLGLQIRNLKLVWLSDLLKVSELVLILHLSDSKSMLVPCTMYSALRGESESEFNSLFEQLYWEKIHIKSPPLKCIV